MCEYDPSQEVSRAPPAATPSVAQASPPPASSPGVAQLVSQTPPEGDRQCSREKAAVAVASGALLRSVGAMTVASPTLLGEIPAIASFIGSAIALGATAADLANCQEEAAARAK